MNSRSKPPKLRLVYSQPRCGEAVAKQPCTHPRMRKRGKWARWCPDCARHVCPQERQT